MRKCKTSMRCDQVYCSSLLDHISIDVVFFAALSFLRLDRPTAIHPCRHSIYHTMLSHCVLSASDFVFCCLGGQVCVEVANRAIFATQAALQPARLLAGNGQFSNTHRSKVDLLRAHVKHRRSSSRDIFVGDASFDIHPLLKFKS